MMLFRIVRMLAAVSSVSSMIYFSVSGTCNLLVEVLRHALHRAGRGQAHADAERLVAIHLTVSSRACTVCASSRASLSA